MNGDSFIPVDVFINCKLGFEFPNHEEQEEQFAPVLQVDPTFWDRPLFVSEVSVV